MVSCPHCHGTTYRLENLEPVDSAFKFNAVACIGCGAAIGVLDFHNTGEQLKKVQAQLDRIENLLTQRR